MTKPTFAARIFLGIFLTASILVACNNEKKDEKKDEKMEQKMDTSANKMDTGSTKPVQPGN